MQAVCPLCSSLSEEFYTKKDVYYRCKTCDAIFVDEKNRPNTIDEKQRYELHNDDASDDGYRKFLSPLTSSIMREYKTDDQGLDFGAGNSAVISVILKESHYNILSYDPYFHNYLDLLKKKYDYISSSEVIEHFYNPHKEFQVLKSMLKAGAKLYIMTELYKEGIDFASWYYKNDPTHVFFYSEKTFEWIKNEFGFSSVCIDKRLIVFSN